jgi:hypothetical protein
MKILLPHLNAHYGPRCKKTQLLILGGHLNSYLNIWNMMHGAHNNFQGGDISVGGNHAKTQSTNNINFQDDSIHNSSTSHGLGVVAYVNP